jgi:hypothetical protein
MLERMLSFNFEQNAIFAVDLGIPYDTYNSCWPMLVCCLSRTPGKSIRRG